LKGVAVATTGFGATSFGFVTRKDPGSPTKGLESMYSLPYVRQRLRDSERVWSAVCSALGVLRVVDKGALLPVPVSCVPGMGVLSLLLCVGCVLVVAVKGLDVGGRYVWPREGVKSGRGDAVERSLVRQETVES
jgi:hypothetical protein